MSAGAGDSLASAGAEAVLPEADPAVRSAPHRWVFALTIAFLGLAALLRTVLEFDGEERLVVLALLGVWFLLVLAEPLAERRWAPSFVAYLVAQTVVVYVLLGWSDSSDYYAILLAVPAMQAMERWRPRYVWLLLGLFAVVIGAGTAGAFHAAALTLVVIYTAVGVFFAAYALAARRAVEVRTRNEALAADLRQANQRLEEYAEQAERLGAARERQRLARDLHDSVTQTLFSMTLTAESARLLLRREPGGVAAQLDQIDQLGRAALDELAALRGGPESSVPLEGGLVAALERHCAERKLRDGLVVALDVEGAERLPAGAEQALLRIAQEGLNNVAKHAGVREATVRLRLRHPYRLEVEDDGCGFDPALAAGPGLGLTSMRERAAEVGWTLAVASLPGGGTRVAAEEAAGEEGP